MSGKRNVILIVDDMEINRAILRGVLEDEYHILEAENGEQAMLLVEQYRSAIAVMLLDVVMPVKNGYEVLKEMSARGFLDQIPVVMVTAEGSAESEVRAFDLGASDIVMKPFEPHVIRRRVQNIIELNLHKLHLEDLVEEQAQSLRESNEIITDALSSVIEYRSMESGQHILRIRMFTKILLHDVACNCREYGLDERKIESITRAAAMHDVGKIAIPDSILNKPGRLTDEEFEIMKTHTTKGCAMLDGLSRLGDQEYLRYAYNICRYHHERWDGRGYPDKLKGDNIPICAQVAGIADCYDALTTDRVYKKAYSHEKAMNMILNGECGAFSPKLLECLKNVGEQFRVLAREYADGRSPSADFQPRPEAEFLHEVDTAQLTQTKYFTVLRYLNVPVLEVDLDADIYHMVYAPNDDFDQLRSGGSFRQCFHAFVQSSVHPDDRRRVEETMENYLSTFFEEGLMKRSREYRVFRRSTGDYHWYRATLLRIDTEDPHRHRAMMIWRDIGGELSLRRSEDGEKTEQDVVALARNIPGGIVQCRNDSQLTMVRAGAGLTAMFGYNEEEIAQRFQNRLLAMLHPDDRAQAAAQVREQLQAGNAVELEYRVRRKDGSTVWVLDKGQVVEEDGDEYLYCVLVDVTRDKRAREELRLSLERHQIIMDQTDDIIFEWDMLTDQISYSQNWEKKFGYPPAGERSAMGMASSSHIYPDDRPALEELIDKLAAGTSYAQAEYRIAAADGRYLWCRTRASAQYDENGRPIKAVGVILDVDSEKSRTRALQAKAEMDALTGLCNKAAMHRRVEQYLEQRESGEIGAMLILDVDNFKLINDSYGHMFGDAVLTQISDRIRELFRGGDIIGRIGGDEFMVFLPRLPNREVAENRAGLLVESFQELFEGELDKCPLSCSIGIAYAPEDGLCYQDLFQRADRALYQAKSQGKNCFVAYDGRWMDQSFGDLTPAGSALGARIDSDERGATKTSGFIQYVFQILYRAGNVEEAVESILEMAGRQFDVSRAYIFENDGENRYCTNTFEWCNTGIEPQIDKLQSVSFDGDLGGGYMENFNENGIFYCPDISELPQAQQDILVPQGIKSMLQCAIRDNGRFRGWVGFDENGENRLWTKDQIDALTFVAELLSVFLLKMRAQEKTETAAQGLLMALDNQNSWIYVVDPDTYEMLFINAKTRAIAPEAEVGMCCYRAFFGRSGPCEQCPARNIRTSVNRTMEVYNRILNVWSSADAALIRWEGREACLLTCHDITCYKKSRLEE